MKKVTVLLSSEVDVHSDFLSGLGTDRSSILMLCMRPTPAMEQACEIFKYDTFSLETNDPKINEYVKTRDGIIMVVNIEHYNNHLHERIVDLTKYVPLENPIVYVFEQYKEGKLTKNLCETLKNLTQSENRKAFHVDYTAKSKHDIFVIDPSSVGMAVNPSHGKVVKAPAHQENEPKNWFYSMMRNLNTKPKVVVPNSNNIKTLTSKNISIDEMVKQFENKTMSLTLWDHYGRLRIVSYSLCKYGYSKTIDPYGWLCTTWKNYKVSIGHGNLWHYTLTRFWTNIIYNLQRKNNYKTFKELYESNQMIQSGKFYSKYYTDDVLFSDVLFSVVARNEWVKPNINHQLNNNA
jgi:hypothetical protein